MTPTSSGCHVHPGGKHRPGPDCDLDPDGAAVVIDGSLAASVSRRYLAALRGLASAAGCREQGQRRCMPCRLPLPRPPQPQQTDASSPKPLMCGRFCSAKSMELFLLSPTVCTPTRFCFWLTSCVLPRSLPGSPRPSATCPDRLHAILCRCNHNRHIDFLFSLLSLLFS